MKLLHVLKFRFNEVDSYITTVENSSDKFNYLSSMLERLTYELKELAQIFCTVEEELENIRHNFHDAFPETYARYVNSFRWKRECLEISSANFTPNTLSSHVGKQLQHAYNSVISKLEHNETKLIT